MNYAKCEEDQNLRIKFGILVLYRHIALLKRTHKQVKLRYRIYIYKTTHKHSDRILAVSPEIYLLLSLTMLRCYGPQRVWATNSTFPCDHQNQLDKPSLRDVLCKFSPFHMTGFAGSIYFNLLVCTFKQRNMSVMTRVSNFILQF